MNQTNYTTNKVISLLITILIFSCSSYKNSDNNEQEYFEGIVTYKIDYKPYTDKFTPEQLKESIGDKMILTFKNEFFKKEYFSPNGKLLSERFLDLEEKKSYSKSYDNDTVYWFDITKNDSKTNFIQINDTIILNESAIGVKTKTTVEMDIFPDKVFKVGGKWYYSKKLKVDANWYEDYKEGNFDEIIKVGNGILLLSINKGIYWEQIYEAIDIENKSSINIEDLKIKINKTTLLKEL